MLGQQIALPESKPDTKTLLSRKGVGGRVVLSPWKPMEDFFIESFSRGFDALNNGIV